MSRTTDWDAQHHTQLAPESPCGFHSVFMATNLAPSTEASTVGCHFENQISGAELRRTKKPVRKRLIN
jgi:hypothetical protein